MLRPDDLPYYTATARFDVDNSASIDFKVDDLSGLGLTENDVIQAIYNLLAPNADSVGVVLLTGVNVDVTPSAP